MSRPSSSRMLFWTGVPVRRRSQRTRRAAESATRAARVALPAVLRRCASSTTTDAHVTEARWAASVRRVS